MSNHWKKADGNVGLFYLGNFYVFYARGLVLSVKYVKIALVQVRERERERGGGRLNEMKKSPTKKPDGESTKTKKWRQEYQLLYRLCQVPELGWDIVNKAKAGDKTALDTIWFYAVQGHRKSAVLDWVDQQRTKLAEAQSAKRELRKGKDAIRNRRSKNG